MGRRLRGIRTLVGDRAMRAKLGDEAQRACSVWLEYQVAGEGREQWGIRQEE